MRISTKVLIGFAVSMFFSVTGFIIQYKLSKEVERNIGFVSNSEGVIRNSTSLHKSVIEMQAAVRGFLLTDSEIFLDPYYEGLEVIPVIIKEQKELVHSSPSQLSKIDSIETLHSQWTEYANNLLLSKKESYYDQKGKAKYAEAFQKRLIKGEGVKLAKEIKQKFQEFDKNEYHNRSIRRENLKHSIHFANTASVSIILTDIIVAIIISYFILISVSKRISTMVSWAEEISKGNFIVIRDSSRDELRKLSDSLNTMSKQLSQSFTELREKNRDLDQVAYATSHDLKAPLRGMYNILTWIEEDLGNEISDQLKNYHNKLKGRIIRLEKLINGMLEYARISKKERTKETVNLQEMLLNITDLLVPPGFKIYIKHNISTIQTQKILLEQVLTNLVSNAVKFQNKPGEESITIECLEFKDYYQFSVADNGIGISTEYYDKIFTLFQTLREKHESEDTGIGLAIVKKIIEERKGRIDVTSLPGEGSVFTFTWPKIIND